jgi:hypothetical protein
MRLRLPLAAAFAAIVAACGLVAGTASAAPATGGITAPINTTTAAGALQGVLNVTGFAVQNGQLVANGVFTGTLTDANNVVHDVTQAVTNIVVNNAATGGGCQILDLTLGPLNLNLLGLVVTLNQVHLNITAQPGPGNLLGNLLCSVSHLLDNGNTSGLQGLLNTLNGLLAGL